MKLTVNPWRALGWGLACCLLALPWLAMQWTPEVNWQAADFAVFALMLLATGASLEWLLSCSPSRKQTFASVLLVISVLILVWLSLGVGMIGADGEPLNVVYSLVLLRFLWGVGQRHARNMQRTCIHMAVIQGAIMTVAILGQWGMPPSSALQLFFSNGVFVFVYLLCAILYGQRGDSGASPA